MGGGIDATVATDSDSLERTYSFEGNSWSGEESNNHSGADYESVDDPVLYGNKPKQVSGELGSQNSTITGESSQGSTETLLNTPANIQFSKSGGEVDSRKAKLQDDDSDTEAGSEGNSPERVDRETQNFSASAAQESKNYLENEFGFEDATLKQQQFLWGLEGDSKEERRRAEMRRKIIQKRSMWKLLSGKNQDQKEKLLRYKPGVWLVETGGMNKCDYQIPTVTTLLLVGPKGAGKSTLINNILRVLGSGNERLQGAQVYCKSSAENGSYFLQEYTVPGASKAFCIFDSRGLSQNVAKDFPVLKKWMVNGIRHGEMVVRSSDDNTVRMSMKHKAREKHYKLSKIRKVNFVIFVVSALSILKIMDSGDIRASDTLVKLFSYPYISFKDDKPVVVMTHGDVLAAADRIRAHIFLGQLLGVSAVDQVFDISDDQDLVADMSLLDMLECSLQRADRNLPYKEKYVVQQFVSMVKELNIGARWLMNTLRRDELKFFVMVVMIAILVWWLEYSQRQKQSKIEWKPKIKWHQIRHLWLG